MPSTAPDGLSTWDVVGAARRPNLNDCGGASMVNDTSDNGANLPPTDGTYPEATWLNQGQRQQSAAGQVITSARMTIDVTAGVPGIVQLMAPGLTVVPGDFDVIDDGVGEVIIEWDAGRLPEMTCDPMVTVNAHGDHGATATIVDATSIRVETRTAGVLADLRFTVAIY